jgi:hypothetical protein
MSALEGRWAQMPNGRLVRIIGVDEDMVIAETTSGTTVDRPLAHVQARWTLLADDSLTVQATTNPDAVKGRLQANPVDLVVDAIRELGGEAETARIQELLERTVGTWVGTGDDLKDWWRRVQQKLGDDSRIDDSRSLERRYRLLEEGEGKRQPLRDRVSEDERGGRRLAFAPLLRSARERARAKKPPLTGDERIELQREAALADLPGLDPTDRFMAAELGTWIGRQTVAEASAALSEDLLHLDLLRIPHKASRDASLDWLSTWLDSHLEDWSWQGAGAPPTLASAAAGSSTDLLTVPWYWDPSVMIVMAPDIRSFEGSPIYDHGGVSPQECVTPVVTVSSGVARGAVSIEVEWHRLRALVTVAGAPPDAHVDIRTKAGDVATSIASRMTEVGVDGMASVLVPDDDQEGRDVFVIVLDKSGRVLAQEPVTVGGL